MGSTTDEPEAIDTSIHMADSSNTSPVSSSTPTESAPLKRSKHSGAGRKGSLMFTPGGSVGLGASNVMSPNNITLARKYEMDHAEPEVTSMSFTVQSSAPANGIESDHADAGPPNGSNMSKKSDEMQTVPSAPSLRSSKGRKGSLMFTTSGTVGLGSNTILQNRSTDSPSSHTEHSVVDKMEQSEPLSAPVTHTMKNGNGRKGSLMFTNNGTIGLGSTPSGEVKEPDHPVVNYSNNVHEYTGDQPPVTFYTGVPQNQPILDERPITYFTQPNPSLYSNLNGMKVPYIPPPQDPPQLLSGDYFVSQLLKAELEGNRPRALELERRGSCVVTPGGMGGLGLKGFEDASSDEEYKSKRKTGSLPGSEDYRPLVGGFAAAAYEAAKAHHYKAKQRSTSIVEESEEDKKLPRLPPPCI